MTMAKDTLKREARSVIRESCEIVRGLNTVKCKKIIRPTALAVNAD